MYFPSLDPYSVLLTLTLILLTHYNGHQEEYQYETQKSIVQEVSTDIQEQRQEGK